MSPTSFFMMTFSSATVSIHLTRSSFRLCLSFSALESLCRHLSTSKPRRFFSLRVSSHFFCKLATSSMTSDSSFCFSSNSILAADSSEFIFSRRSCLGATSLATWLYTFIAWTHMHMPAAATDTFLTLSGCMSGFSMYLVIFARVIADMLSLSKLDNSSMYVGLLRTFLADSQVGCSCSKIQTASITVCTISGGFVKPRISIMSFFSRLSKALTAFW
mmetsp:Transcript_7161/g.14905  ORF Transcript_7161/g.14905 Transcript_7161/m.14905 type:complete len:217 (-) Transcript_7161:118-768(-)